MIICGVICYVPRLVGDIRFPSAYINNVLEKRSGLAHDTSEKARVG